ncbi:MAG: hypothetical protein C0467_03135 [Planctomycetaceae bacterium]|nr:hypothetical protein [Planctomycetaceae bacterium]
MVASPLTCPSCQTAVPAEQIPADSNFDVTCPVCGEAIPILAGSSAIELLPGMLNTAISLTPEPTENGFVPSHPTEFGPTAPHSSHDFPFLKPPAQEDEIGRLGQYRILGLLGMGGMGVVFRAEDPQLKRQIALKAMLPAYATNPADVARFLREARSQAAVEHDHVAAIHQVGEDRGVPFIAMPLLKGQPLSSAIKPNTQVPLFEAIRIAREMAEGLAAAHACGLIHRDIKPANVWLEGKNRRVKILDFGLARFGDNGPRSGEFSTPMTQQGIVVGTPAYMSPEQAKGDPLDARSDLFSLGIVLYQMLTGREPFRAGNVTGLLIAVATEHPPRPAAINPLVPPELDSFTMQMLAKNREDRPATAEVVATELRQIESKVEITSLGTPNNADQQREPNLPQGHWVSGSGLTERSAGGSQATGEMPSSVRSSIESEDRHPPRKRTWLMVALLLGFTMGGIVAADIIIKIKNKDGTETEIKVPDGSTVTVKQDGKDVAKIGPEQKKEPEQKIPIPAGPLDDRQAAKYVFALGGKVWINNALNDKDQIVFESDLPKVPFTLTGINMWGTEVTNAGMAPFRHCKNLIILGLSNTQVGNTGLAYFKDHKKLLRLHLSGSRITDEGLAIFKDSKNIIDLLINYNPITDAGLANFKECKNLNSIWLKGTKVTDEGMAMFKDFKNMTWVEVSETKVTDKGLANFADCTRLTHLLLRGTPVTDDGLSHFIECKQLLWVDVRETKVTAEKLKELAESVPRCRIDWDGGVFRLKTK